MPLTEARRQANKRYNAKTYNTFSISVRKDSEDSNLFEQLDNYCKITHVSRNKVVATAMADYLDNHAIEKKEVK